MYYPDLSPLGCHGTVTVGWLSLDQPFTEGAVPEEFLTALRRLVKAPVNLMRGSHVCEFCPAPPTYEKNGLKWIFPPPETTGNGEIRVLGDSGRTLVAPVLVLHYVEVHQYQPPAEFIRACIASGLEFFKSSAQVAVAKAAAEGRTDQLEMLTEHGAQVNAQGLEGMTALYWAVANSSKKSVSWLLEHGADPNVIFAHDGTSATSLAAREQDPWFLKEVLAHGGNANISNPLNGRTPLFEALATSRNDNARALIAAGADVNTVDDLGWTPVWEALADEKYELVYDMLQAGADPTTKIPKSNGKTLVWWIRRCRPVLPPEHWDEWLLRVVDFLRKKGLDVEHGD